MAADNIEEAIPLKLENFPKSFFKYRCLTELTLQALDQNYIWLAEIAALNDPFECSIQFDNDECLRKFYGSTQFQRHFSKLTGHILTPENVQELTNAEKPFLAYQTICNSKRIPFSQTSEEQLSKVQSRWAQIVEEANQNLRICSFSLINSSLLLWSHYASEHKGIAIEYDFLDVDGVRTFVQPVVYSNRIHKIRLFEDYSVIQLVAASLIKSKDWEYEQEWRVTEFKKRQNFLQKMSVPNPTGIYLGTRFHQNEKELKDRLFAICFARKIPVYQMSKHPNEFRLISSLTEM
jgi:hypothetical protein